MNNCRIMANRKSRRTKWNENYIDLIELTTVTQVQSERKRSQIVNVNINQAECMIRLGLCIMTVPRCLTGNKSQSAFTLSFTSCCFLSSVRPFAQALRKRGCAPIDARMTFACKIFRPLETVAGSKCGREGVLLQCIGWHFKMVIFVWTA